MAKLQSAWTFLSRSEYFNGEKIVRDAYKQGIQLLEVKNEENSIFLLTKKYANELFKHINLYEQVSKTLIIVNLINTDNVCENMEIIPYIDEEDSLIMTTTILKENKKPRYVVGIEDTDNKVHAEVIHELLLKEKKKKGKLKRTRTYVNGYRL